MQYRVINLVTFSGLFDLSSSTVRNTATTPDAGEDVAVTPGDVRKGGFEVRISKEPLQDDAVE